ncbi:hypothetical protein ACFQL4_10985 [Halosimplex aquaticum]
MQEAIDTIAQVFDHPSSLSVRYTTADGIKRTTFELNATDESFEVTYDGGDETAEPQLSRLD